MKKEGVALLVAVDSDITRKDRAFNKKDFLFLKELSQLNLVQIHISWVVYKECTTGYIAEIETEITSALANLKNLERKGLHTDDSKTAEKISGNLETLKSNVKVSVEKVWSDYVRETKAVLHAFDPADSSTVLDDYFSGRPPFKTLKSRDDIPDAFILQTLRGISKSKTLHFISGDANLRKACGSEKNILVYKDFDDFFGSKEFRPVDDRHKEIKKYEALKDTLFTRISEVEKQVESYFLNDFKQINIEDDYLPSDDHMGEIVGVEDLISLQVLRDEIKFVDDEFYLTVEVNAECLIDYFIFKSEYWMIGDEREIHIIDDDWNDHYFWVQESLSVKFLLTIIIPKEDLEEDLEFEIEVKDFDEISILIPEGKHKRKSDFSDM